MIVMLDNTKTSDKVRKLLFKLFHDLKFKITTELNKRPLSIWMLKTAVIVSPYLKANTIVTDRNVKSNDPPTIIKLITKGIECRLSRDSSSKLTFCQI